MKYTAIIIGLGNIGQGYDYDKTNDSFILTHATAFKYHPNFELIAGVDVCKEACNKFEAKFNVPGYLSVNEALTHCKPDIVVVAVGVENRATILEQLVTLNPKAIICEKPFAQDLAHAYELEKICQKIGGRVLVNYIRRFEPGVVKLKELIENKTFGGIYKGVGFYGKGLRHNGSHLVNLLQFLLGDIIDVEVLDNKSLQQEQLDVVLKFKKAQISLLSSNHQYYPIFDLRLIGTKGQINYINSGEHIKYNLVADKSNFGSNALSEYEIKTDFYRYQYHVLEGLNNYLQNKMGLASNMQSALETEKVLQMIFEKNILVKA